MDKLAMKLAKGYFTLEQLGVKLADVRRLKDKGYRVTTTVAGKDTFYSTLSGSENVSCFISGKPKKPTEYRWVEMADLHIGSRHFDEPGLRDILSKAVDQGYEEVHIAGDVCDGYTVHKQQLKELRLWRAEEQAELAAEIFSDYKLRYYAITGNHEESYENLGSPNPNALIQMMMKDYTFLHTITGDLVIGGVVARMNHLSGGGAYQMSYPAQKYVRNLLGDDEPFYALIHGKLLRIRFICFGHLHTSLLFKNAGIYISHPGNFQLGSSFTKSKGLVGPQGARFVRAVIHDGDVLEYQSDFVKPRRGR